MSVLIKRIDSSSGGGSSKGYPPGNVTNVTIKGGYKKVTIKWTDPDDIVIGDKTLSTWQSTTLVRKKGSIPTSIKDGDIVLETTEKNKYKNTEYTDNNLEIGTYYYRFFVCNTDKIYNNDSSMIYSAAVVEFDPVLKNNTWEQINAAAESGIASSLWKVGDEIDLTLSGKYNETVTLQIWDFNHFDKSDGSGKASICFGMKNLMGHTINSYGLTGGYTSEIGWDGSNLKDDMPDILNSMPSNLQSYIKEVNTYANGGHGSKDASVGRLSKDKVFLPGYIEASGGNDIIQEQAITESGQKQFPIFTDDNSRKKRLKNGRGDYESWWLRSPSYKDIHSQCIVFYDGDVLRADVLVNNEGYTYNYSGICFCFNV